MMSDSDESVGSKDSSDYYPSDDSNDDMDMEVNFGRGRGGSRRKDVHGPMAPNDESDSYCGLYYQTEDIDFEGAGAGRLHTAMMMMTKSGDPSISSSREVPFEEWATLMAEQSARGEQARSVTIQQIKMAPFPAAFFETKGVNLDTAGREKFCFVLIDSPDLCQFCQGGADIDTFSSHFTEEPDEDAVAFENLGGDALLIAPTPDCNNNNNNNNLETHSHLVKFVREAKASRVHSLFAKVASKLLVHLQSVSPEPVWLSTSGLGVAWLHFRLDSSPKYYQYQPFVEPARRRNPFRNAQTHVGRRVAKRFGGDVFFGTIKKYIDEFELWHVVYDDEDQEEYDSKDLRKALSLYSKESTNSSVGREEKLTENKPNAGLKWYEY